MKPPITFRPTYRYSEDGITYDKGEASRIPSWTDRILYQSKKPVRCLQYGAIQDINISVHKPVFALFELHLSGATYYSILEPKIGGVQSEVCNIL